MINGIDFFTWTRDAALTLKMIIDEFVLGNTGLQMYIDDYVHAQAILQTVVNPSGAFLPSGRSLGEPKFKVTGARFNGAWGRPQRDGPALRAISLITYSKWLVDSGNVGKARNIIWPVIANDLSYVGQYWYAPYPSKKYLKFIPHWLDLPPERAVVTHISYRNTTGFDLWEEVSGSSFFTTQNQYRSLAEGAQLAATLGVTCSACEQAPQILCFLQSYWNGEYFVANTNTGENRSGKDANTILGPISIFDINAPCDSLTYQPCHSYSLATFKVLIDTFREPTLYPINEGIPRNQGVAVGRYPEDKYFGGNPW
jgi:glucoamylase